MTASSSPTKPVAPNLIAAGLCAVVAIAYAGSFGRLIFGGPLLEPFVGRAVLAALVSSIVVMAVLAWRSSFYFSLGGPDSNPVAILAFTFAAMSSEMLRSAGGGAAALWPTVLLFLFLSSVGCGVVLYALGRARWGRYVRYLPHPVVGGFLAGTGFLLSAGAWEMLTGQRLALGSLASIAEVHPLALAFTLGTAATLLILSRLMKHYFVIPAVLLGAAVVFHAVRLGWGLDLAAARQLGLVLAPLQIGDWTNFVNLPYPEIRWDLVLLHGKDFAAMTTVALITTLLNTTSIELAAGAEGDADQELKAVGLANVFAGLAGGMVAVISYNRSLLNLRAGANSRWAAVGSAGIVLVAMAAAPWAIGWLPTPVLTGLILFLGVALLLTWLVDARRQMPTLDYLLLLAILSIVIAQGIVAGVVLGLVIACVSFVFTLSRSPAIRHDFTLRTRRSNVERPASRIALLQAHGGAVRGFSLQGSLFFGTTSRLLDEVRLVLGQTRYVLLDFRLVHSVDGSATVALTKLKKLCADAHLTLVLTDLSLEVRTALHHGNLDLSDPTLRIFDDLDHGLEWCEEELIRAFEPTSSLAQTLSDVFTPDEFAYLDAHFPRREIAHGSLLVLQGDARDVMFIIETGRVSICLHVDADKNATARLLRLRTYPAGTVVGEMGFYTGATRSADIIADTDTVAIELTAAHLAQLESDTPALAHKLHRFIARSLSQRLAAANDEIRALI